MTRAGSCAYFSKLLKGLWRHTLSGGTQPELVPRIYLKAKSLKNVISGTQGKRAESGSQKNQYVGGTSSFPGGKAAQAGKADQNEMCDPKPLW